MEEKACWKLGRKSIICSAAQFRSCRILLAAAQAESKEPETHKARNLQSTIFNLQFPRRGGNTFRLYLQ
jgi:hypothetical protein